MPNWCNNTLIVTSDSEAELNRFIAFVKSDNSDFDFEKIIPSTRTKAYWKKQWNTMPKKKREKETDFDTYWFNTGKGYNWCVKNWGTKWYVSDVDVNIADESMVEYMFNSAWSPPLAITRKLIKLFPKLDFKHNYDEDGMGYEGILESNNGIIIEDRDWGIEYEACPKCDLPNKKTDAQKTFYCIDCELEYIVSK